MRTCMGGWCTQWRETCARYQPGTDFKATAERLCAPGHHEYYVPLMALAPKVLNADGRHPLQR